jgi:DNA-binding transcriptional ArsR family regulator
MRYGRLVKSRGSPTKRGRGAAEEDRLDLIFHALADRTRRGMLDALSRGPQPVGALAAPYDMSKPAISKHLKVLERAGLVRRSIDGRIHRCSLETEPLNRVQQWIEERRTMWEDVLDSLAELLEEGEQDE